MRMPSKLFQKRVKYIIVFLVFIIGVFFVVLKYNAEKVIYNQNLTQEQKMEDFEQFYTIVSKSVPFLEDIMDIYGIDFVGRKEYYESMITRTSNNAEFYATMQAISRDLCSFHTDICYPFYNNIRGIQGYNSRTIANIKGMKETQNLWFDSLGREMKESNTEDIVSVVYFDGEYVVIDSKVDGINEGDRLITVNEVPANDYLVQHISLGKICYDGKRKSAYRTQYAFNGSSGDVVNVVWRNKQGEEYTTELYHSLMGELVMGYGSLYEDAEEQTVSELIPSVYSHRDDENQIEYIKIADFDNNEGEKIKKIISEMKYETVIIDLRGNYGGNIKYFENYIYPNLYSTDILDNRYWMTNKTKHNNKMINNITVNINKYSETQDCLVYRLSSKFVGRYEGEEKNIYYLVDDSTGSSADFAAMIVKNNKLGTLVGENTRGEGGAQSFICDKLDNSGLVFIYFSAVACNAEGQKIFTPGTEPDVYIAASYEDYLAKLQYTDSKYENLVKYDPLLKWIIKNRILYSKDEPETVMN